MCAILLYKIILKIMKTTALIPNIGAVRPEQAVGSDRGQHCLPPVQFLDVSIGAKWTLKFWDKYGQELRCRNIWG